MTAPVCPSVAPRPSDLIRSTFAVPEAGIWVTRGGVTTRGTRPHWLDWPSVTGDQIARSPWNMAVATKAHKAVKP
jgi:hypothetical protein